VLRRKRFLVIDQPAHLDVAMPGDFRTAQQGGIAKCITARDIIDGAISEDLAAHAGGERSCLESRNCQ
jgi:hypothetical protein